MSELQCKRIIWPLTTGLLMPDHTMLFLSLVGHSPYSWIRHIKTLHYKNNCRLLILTSVQTYFICPERETWQNKGVYNVKLRLFDHKMAPTAYIAMTHPDSFAVAASFWKFWIRRIETNHSWAFLLERDVTMLSYVLSQQKSHVNRA